LDYSPYHNVKDRTPYPAVLLTAGENDPRCHPLHAMKMAALLQEANGGGNPILLHVEKGAGHGTGLLLEKEINKKAKGWAFLMSHVGMTAPPKVR
jgi:prolyl oligopeptidase